MQVFADAVSTPVWEEWGINFYHRVVIGQRYLLVQFLGKMHRLATIHTLQTTDRQTDRHNIIP